MRRKQNTVEHREFIHYQINRSIGLVEAIVRESNIKAIPCLSFALAKDGTHTDTITGELVLPMLEAQPEVVETHAGGPSRRSSSLSYWKG